MHRVDHDWDRCHDYVGALQELALHDNEEHGPGESCTEPIDRGASPPPRLLCPSPVPDHSTLRESEGDEYADEIELNQAVQFGFEHDDQQRGEEGQDDHAVGEDKP